MMLCCGKNTLRGISNKLHAAWGIHSHRGFAGWRDLLLLLCASSTLCRFCHQFLVGLICMIFPFPFMHKVYCGCGILLFSFYLIYDTQMIMGNHELCIGIDDYCFA